MLAEHTAHETTHEPIFYVDTKPDISIIIPCYNEEQVLEGSVEKIRRLMEQTRYLYEIVFVDDRGQDGTREILKKLEKYPEHTVIYHEKNTGVGGATIDGIRAAKADIIVAVDVDLETGIHYLPIFVQAIEDGYDMAYGHRLYESKPSIYYFARRLLSMGYRWLVNNYAGIPSKDTQCGFKSFNKNTMMQVFDDIAEMGWVWDTELFAVAKQHNKKVKPIRVIFSRRFDKTSSVRLWEDTFGMFQGLRRIKRRMRKK